jgi:uncharacterized Zn-finger protein
MCTICGKQFHRSDYLKLHSYSHTDERPFICHLCGKGFKMNYNLKLHLKHHEHQDLIQSELYNYNEMSDDINSFNNNQDHLDNFDMETINNTGENFNISNKSVSSSASASTSAMSSIVDENNKMDSVMQRIIISNDEDILNAHEINSFLCETGIESGVKIATNQKASNTLVNKISEKPNDLLNDIAVGILGGNHQLDLVTSS